MRLGSTFDSRYYSRVFISGRVRLLKAIKKDLITTARAQIEAKSKTSPLSGLFLTFYAAAD